ncbi:MAG: hypothetical protein Kow0013_01790 [Pararhodobacter sp.]
MLILSVVGCASPDRTFWGVDPVEVVIDERRYVVYAQTDARRPRVQVIRMGYARRAEHVAILQAMRQAAVQVSGCALVEGSVQGDSGVLTARLDCH